MFLQNPRCKEIKAKIKIEIKIFLFSVLEIMPGHIRLITEERCTDIWVKVFAVIPIVILLLGMKEFASLVVKEKRLFKSSLFFSFLASIQLIIVTYYMIINNYYFSVVTYSINIVVLVIIVISIIKKRKRLK